MSELHWFGLSLPREMDLKDVVAVLRPLATRPRLGLAAVTPLVVFELHGKGGKISWRLGVDARIASHLPSELAAHLPRLGIESMAEVARPPLSVAADLRMDGVSSPLRSDTASAVSAGLLSALRQIGRSETGVVQWLVGPSRQRQVPPAPFDLAEALGLSSPSRPDSTAVRLWREKTAEPLFACRGRVGALAASTARASGLVRGLADALKLANTAQTGLWLGRATKSRAVKMRQVAGSPLTWSCLLNATELATLIGWPLVDETNADDLALVGGHINAVPGRLLVTDDAGADERVLGESLHTGQRGDLVTVPVKTSLHHLHVIGPTGSGKSSLLAGLVMADMAAGRSVLVVEPKGDLCQDVLARVPAHRRDDVVLIKPDSDPVGLNVFSGSRDQAERRADQIVGLLHELHGANFGPRTADVALHAFITVARLNDGTLADVPVLLTNPAFRRRVLAQVSDPLVLGPWWAWYDALSDAERGQVIAPLLNKTRAFLSRDALRRMLAQAEPRFNLDDLFTKKRIVLVDLNKGMLGPESSSLLGALLLTQLWSAIQRRTSVPAAKRHAVMVVIDEVQDYLHLPGVDLGDALAQARGLGVSLTMAHQHLGQLNPFQRAAILANARSRVLFRPATDDAKALAASFGNDLNGDDLLRLRAFEACVQLLVEGQPTRPFSVRTRPLPPWTSNPEALRRASRERYGVDGVVLDAALQERWQGGTGTHDGPVGFKPRRSS